MQDRDNVEEELILSDNVGMSSLANRSRIHLKRSLSRPVEEPKHKLFMKYTISQDMTTRDDSQSKDRLCAIRARKLEIMLR